jgi:hypothetical protein
MNKYHLGDEVKYMETLPDWREFDVNQHVKAGKITGIMLKDKVFWYQIDTYENGWTEECNIDKESPANILNSIRSRIEEHYMGILVDVDKAIGSLGE